jgi:signal transduction histidine kinase
MPTPRAAGGPGDATARCERTIARTAAASRCGALALLVWVAAAGLRGWAPAALAVGVAGSLVLVAACLRGGRPRAWWVVADLVCVAALLVLTGLPAAGTGPAHQSPCYLFAATAVIVVWLPRWPFSAAMGAAALPAAGNLATALPAGSAYPVWNAVPDSLSFFAVALVCWVLGWLLRSAAAVVDDHHRRALEDAAAMARERERRRQGRTLGAALLLPMDELAAGELIPDPVLRGHVAREARWLREVVSCGVPSDTGGLCAALRGVVADAEVSGLRATTIISDRPEVESAATAAVAEAAREALTNVVKHAGVGSAVVTVGRDGAGVCVEIADAGCGYDAGATAAGFGQTRSIRQRVAEVGGRAEIDSRPGGGTRVRLWVPEARDDRALP